MITILRNAEVYAPERLGVRDVLLVGGKIAAVGEHVSLNAGGAVEVREIEAGGKTLVPGFIDSHVHLLGGGGEGGFSTRTPEATLTDLTKAGVTTAVGCLGTDGVARDPVSLLAKARGLEEEGITTYIYTGSYRVPFRTITGEVMKDLMVVDKVIGIGEVAVSDHRSSQPAFGEFVRAVADARVGGMLSGKAGIVNIHLGDGQRKIDLLWRAMKETEIPVAQFLPTHVNRNQLLFDECVKYAKAGGYIDFTGSDDPDFWEETDGEVRVSKGVRRLLEEGVNPGNFTLSSDGQGSLPIFNEKKEYVGIGVGKPGCLIKAIRECLFREKIPLETAIGILTANPAKILKLKSKGRIATGMDADLCLLDGNLEIDTVIAKGQLMVQGGRPLVFGTFEARG